MPQCLVGLGSNLGDRLGYLKQAVQRLQDAEGIRIAALSSWYSSKPIGGPTGQGFFLNGAAVLHTDQNPTQLLGLLQETEQSLGRRRTSRWEPRVVDLDLLLYEDLVLEQPGLRVPHPWMAIRPFVVVPAAEIAPEWLHPEIHWTISQCCQLAASQPKIIAIANSDDRLLDAFQSPVVDASPLRQIRFPPLDRTLASGFRLAEAIELISERAGWLAEQLSAHDSEETIVVHGWWNLPWAACRQLENLADLKTLNDSLADIQRTCSLPIPQVMVGLTGASFQHGGGLSATDVDAYLRRRQGGPFLTLNGNELKEIFHDLWAVIDGYQSEVTRNP